MTPRKTVAWAAACWLLGAASPRAAPDARERLTLAEAVARSLAYHPSVLGSIAESEAADAALREARSARRPRLDLAGSATQYQEPMIVHPIHAFTPGQTPNFDDTLLQGFVELSYAVYDGGARAARIEAERFQAQAGGSAVARTEQSLVARVVSAYLLAVAAARILAAREGETAALEAELARAERLVEVGRAAPIEVLRVEAALAAAEAERVRTASSLELAERTLARSTGLPLATARAGRLQPVALSDARLPDREGALARALERSPVLETARRELQSAEARAALARSERSPRMHLIGRYTDWAALDGTNALEWNVGLQLSYPLFTGGEIASSIAGAEARRRAAAERLRAAELEITREVDEALSGAEKSRARVVSLEKAVESFAEVVRIEKLRLEEGAGVQTDYLRAEADLTAARARLIEARHAEIRHRAELARVSGDLGRDWIARNLRDEP